MTTPDCPRTTLVEALRDGRLGAQESASMERHLEGCAICSEMARDLSKIGDAVRAPKEKLTPLEHQRARVALLQRAATQSPARAGTSGHRWTFGAVLVAASVIVGFLGGRWEKPTNRVAVALHMGALPVFNSNSKLGLHPSDDARFNRNRTADADELNLEHGTIDIKLQKLEAGKRFVVRTKDAQIEVRATAFRVEAEDGRIRGVTVEQGTVEVQYAGFTAVITAGGSWRATGDAAEPDKPILKTEFEAGPGSATNGRGSVATNAPIAAKQSEMHAAKRDFVPKAVVAPAKPDSTPPPERADSSPKPETSAPTAAVAAPRTSPASSTFADAMAAMRRGDYATSAEKLSGFAQAYAGDARADEADYLRAIALQRAGRRAEASAAAKQYLTRWPNGAHRADATRIAGK